MGFIVEHHDEEIWSPSLDVGNLFLCQVRHLEHVLDVLAGLDEYMADTVDVDFDTLNTFLTQLAGWASFDNVSLNSLLRGVAVHLLALGFCAASGSLAANALYPHEWVEEAKAMASKRMHRIGT